MDGVRHSARRLARAGRARGRGGRRASPRSWSRSWRSRSSAARFAEGDVLPTEPALCEQFGFSRTVIREGLKLLEERGLVRVEQGRGTTVQPRTPGTCSTRSCSASRSQYDTRHVAARRPDHRPPGARAEMARAAAARLTDGRARRARREPRADGGVLRRLRAVPRVRPRVPRDRHEGLRQRGRADDRAHVIHRHGGVMPPLASAASARGARSGRPREHRAISRRSPRATASSPASGSPRTSSRAWAERKRRASVALDNG